MFISGKAVGKGRGAIGCCALAGVSGVVITILLMIVPAVLISHEVLPANIGDAMTLVCTIVGGVAAGLIVRVGCRGGAVPLGALGGACMAVVLALVIALRGQNAGFDVFSLKLAICGLVGGVMGATLTIDKKRQKRKKHKK